MAKSKKNAALRTQYRAAKAARTKAGKAYRAHKSYQTLHKYKEAERKWQILGEELGKKSGTHKRRRQKTEIFSRHASVTRRRAPVAMGFGHAPTRRKKSTRSRKSR